MAEFSFLFYPGDYLRDTQCLGEKAQVAYDRIMCEHMRNICISKSKLNFFTKRLSPDELEELKMVLAECEGGFQIKWVADSINKRKGFVESRRSNRAGKTKKDMSNISKSYDEHKEIEIVIEKEIVNGKVKEVLTAAKIKKNEPNIDFEFFWQDYDKKIGDKKKLTAKWNALSDQDREDIMAYIPKYKMSQPDKKYRKNPDTFFNNKSWNDEIITSQTISENTNHRQQSAIDRKSSLRDLADRLTQSNPGNPGNLGATGS